MHTKCERRVNQYVAVKDANRKLSLHWENENCIWWKIRIDADLETYLTCLQKLFPLNEIDIREISVNNQHLSWISYLIKYAGNSKLSFKNTYLTIYASHDNTCNELFKETMTNVKHVKDWSFTNINCGKELFALPPSDISLTVRNSIYKNIDFKNARIIKFCLDARKLYNNSTLKKKKNRRTSLASLELGTIDICKNVTFFPDFK